MQTTLTANEPYSTKPLTKSERVVEDDSAPMGKGCNNTIDRVLASTKGFPAPISFDQQIDLSCAGVLLAIPALLSNRLLSYTKMFTNGENKYYSEQSIFLVLALLYLLRIKNINQSLMISSGELGKALGLDRIPEVKTLRKRISTFSEGAALDQWSESLAKDWMYNDPEVGSYYIDGHVILYHGHKTEMPKRYVTRYKLCLSGSTDYWVNNKIGEPFFVVNETINTGMIDVINQRILPQLEKDTPNQPTEEQLKADPKLHKMMIICDRECYSIEFFAGLWEKRVAICTYRKNVKTKWPEEEFVDYELVDEYGNMENVKMSEQVVTLNKKNDQNENISIQCREVRKRNKSGHQTAIITTNWKLSVVEIGQFMFSRWCQENYFKYMAENFGLNAIASYAKVEIPDTKTIVNPAYRDLTSRKKAVSSKLTRAENKLGRYSLKIGEANEEDKNYKKYLKHQSEALQDIELYKKEKEELTAAIKDVDQHIEFSELPKDQQFLSSVNARKKFLDNINMIAYRAETGMYNIIQKSMKQPEQGRSLLQQIFSSDADLYPDLENKILTVKIHNLNTNRHDAALGSLCQVLNETETIFPGTDLRLVYQLVAE
ncbi:putative transposase [Arachidicoccus ginsenosidivorans]